MAHYTFDEVLESLTVISKMLQRYENTYCDEHGNDYRSSDEYKALNVAFECMEMRIKED